MGQIIDYHRYENNANFMNLIVFEPTTKELVFIVLIFRRH